MDTNGKKLINNISEPYCSFEVAKLLKEKGFSVKLNWYYRIAGGKAFNVQSWANWNDDEIHETAGGMTYVSCPTHALACKWIRENFGIYIKIDWFLDDNDNVDWDFAIQEIGTDIDERGDSEYLRDYDIFTGYKLYEEAVEAALLYTLKHII